MSLLVNLRHLETRDVEFKGELPVEELDLDVHDEMIRPAKPLQYDFVVQQLEHNLLVRGKLHLALECNCVRCLKSFERELNLDDWTRLLPLEGDEKVPVSNDCVDLTPYVREDILLEFPQHPLCAAECRGLPQTSVGKERKTGRSETSEPGSSAWSELDKLKF